MKPGRLELGAVMVGVVWALIAWAWGANRLEAKRLAANRDTQRVEAAIKQADADRAVLMAEHEELRMQQAAQGAAAERAPRPDSPETHAAARHVVAELIRQRVIWSTDMRRGKLIDAAGRPTAMFVDLFGLVAGPVEELRAALESARTRVDELALANVTVRRDEAGALVMEVRMPAENAAVREYLRAAIVRAVGEEGLADFEQFEWGGLDAVFRSLGGASRIVTVTREVPPKSGLTIKTQFFNVDGSRGPSTGTGSVDPARVLVALGPLAKLVPADF